VQILTPVGVLDRAKQRDVVREITDIVAAAAGDPGLAERTWVLITESPEGGWGIAGMRIPGPTSPRLHGQNCRQTPEARAKKPAESWMPSRKGRQTLLVI
jgi:phenylpyruvate tautomerase PptA (4-oxalocrotonate tautomerase family)